MKLAKTFVEIDSTNREPAETIIKNFAPIGSIDGHGTVAVSAFQFMAPKRDAAFFSVRFEILSGEEYPQEAICSIELSDAEKLVASLEHLANVNVSTAGFSYTEVEAAVDDLTVVVFNTDSGSVKSLVKANGASCMFHRQTDLFDLAKLIELAADHLRSHMPR